MSNTTQSHNCVVGMATSIGYEEGGYHPGPVLFVHSRETISAVLLDTTGCKLVTGAPLPQTTTTVVYLVS